MPDNFEFDVAISFAGEDRGIAREIADALKAKDVSVFFDEDFEAELWGKDLVEQLHSVYFEKSRFCLILVSHSYRDKLWTTHERRSAQARALQQFSEYILPVQVDESVDLPGLPASVAYVSLSKGIPHVVSLLSRKLSGDTRRAPRQSVAPAARERSKKVERRDIARELLAGTLAEWERWFRPDDWENWVSTLFMAHPWISEQGLDALLRLKSWLPKRNWPAGSSRIEAAFENFGYVAEDLTEVMFPHFFREEAKYVCQQFYRLIEGNKKLYDAKVEEYNNYVHTLQELAFELTRAGNLIIERARDSVDPHYRLLVGKLVVMPDGEAIAAEYSGIEKRSNVPYEGLKPILRRTKWKPRKPSE